VLGVSQENTMYVTMILVVAAAIILLLLSESGKIKGDAAIAMLSTGAVAAGYIIYCLAGIGAGDVCSSLFGSAILALDGGDVTLSVVLAVGVILVFVLLFSKIFAVTFDTAFARSAGTHVSFYNILIAVLTAVTIVVGMKMIGSIMISALTVFPPLTAMRVCKRFKSVIILSAVISAVCFILGLLFAAVVEFEFSRIGVVSLPVGPCVVAFNALAFLLTAGIQKTAHALMRKRVTAKAN